MKLIIGLGNPGKEYLNTRHNVGFIVLDNILKDVKWKEKYKALYYETNIDGQKVIYIKPQTFMNLSGESVCQFVNFYNVDLKDILIIHDDLDLNSLSIRLKKSSSSGGHNGIKNIIEKLNSNEFIQLKVGIGHNNIDVIDYVLGKLSKEELDFLSTELFKNVIKDFINKDFSYLSNKYN